MTAPFRFDLRVYWEDTDAAGIVYYANYLKFAERARTEALLARGIRQTELRARLGVVFAVREATVTYLAPARLEDQLTVTTAVSALAGARVELLQDIWRDDACLAKCRILLACLDAAGRPVRIPAELREALGALGSDPGQITGN